MLKFGSRILAVLGILATVQLLPFDLRHRLWSWFFFDFVLLAASIGYLIWSFRRILWPKDDKPGF